MGGQQRRSQRGEGGARWERIRVPIDAGAAETVGPKEIAKAFEMKETFVSRIGIGTVAAHGSGRKTTEKRRSSGKQRMEKESV
jgi:hypothetical protein